LTEDEENTQISLLQNYPCNNKDELRAKEGEYIQSMNCVNKIKKVGINKRQNAETLKQYNIQYNLENIEKKKQYLRDNAEKIKAHGNQIINCACGGTYRHWHKSDHMKRKKHLNYLNSKNEVV
jgi:hypothetical protein